MTNGENSKELTCDICNNKMYIYKDEKIIACKCVRARESLKYIKRSGLSDILESYTFDTFEAKTDWQKRMKSVAKDFLCFPHGNWLGVFGQVGSGKSHICTAVCGELLKANMDVRYISWRDDITRLKANVMEDEYSTDMNKYKTATVLYIDDLFKTESGKRPTQADVNIAFELLNYRYNNKRLITIVSSEQQLKDLLNIDEAVGSRIYERCRKYHINIDKDKTRNYRLRGM